MTKKHPNKTQKFQNKLLIVYATTDGQTKKIAEQIAEQLQAFTHDVDLLNAEDIKKDFSISDYAAIVVGAPIRYGKYQRCARRFVKQYQQQLNNKISAFFSVSGSAASQNNEQRQQAAEYIKEFLHEYNWQPKLSISFAGAVLYTHYNPLTRYIMKRISAKEGRDTDTHHDYEYTDWTAVEKFAELIHNAVTIK